MANLYLYGYGSGPYGASTTKRSRDYILAQEQFAKVHPEIMRRLFALADEVIARGSQLGFGGGWRSSQIQLNMFLTRYARYTTPVAGSFWWDGRPTWNYYGYWKLKAGYAASAPPGRSYHESTLDGKALAVDMVGNHPLANALCNDFGLKHLGNVNNEPWHYQALEFPNARRDYNGSPIGPWPLPGQYTPPPLPPPGLDDMTPIEPTRTYDTRGIARPDGSMPAGGDQGAFYDGEIRRVPVAVGQTAFIHVTVVNSLFPGWLAVSADGNFAGGTSLVNYVGGEVATAGAPVNCPGGHVYIKVLRQCDVIVDTYAVG